MVDTMILYTITFVYNNPLSQFLCDLVLCSCMLKTADLTPPDMTGYTPDSRPGAWPHQVKSTLPRHQFAHLGFPECPCRLGCNIFPRLFHEYGLMVFDDGRLFPSLNFKRYHKIKVNK